MTNTQRERYLREADRLLSEGDRASARVILDAVAYADRYKR